MFVGIALSTCTKTRIRCRVYNFNIVIADFLVSGATGAFADIIILSGTVVPSEIVMFVDTALSKRQYNAKCAFCHIMTADDLVTCGPNWIIGHNFIFFQYCNAKCVC